MPTPLPTPFISLGWPRSSPEMSPLSTPAATIAWRSRANTGSPNGRPVAGFSRAGPTLKGVKRRRKLPLSATVWPHSRRPVPAYTHRYTARCWLRRWRLPEKSRKALPPWTMHWQKRPSPAEGLGRGNSSLAWRTHRSLAISRSGQDRGLVPHRPGDHPRARHARLRIARRHEPRPAVARAGPARRGARPARAPLRLVHRGLRHRRPERREGPARSAGVSQPPTCPRFGADDRFVRNSMILRAATNVP